MNYEKGKRLFDIMLSICLLISLSPIYAILAIIICIQDGGPAIFKQNRIGKEGVVFMFYKFRTMPICTPNVESKEANRLQITPS